MQRWWFLPNPASLLLLSLMLAPAIVLAADTPVAGLFPDVSPEGVTVPGAGRPLLLGPGMTDLGTLNALGLRTFKLKNNTGAAISSLLVAIDVGAPPASGQFNCSSLPGLLSSCQASTAGSVVYLHFTGTPPIDPDATFLLGFAGSEDGKSWPPQRPVSVTVNGKPPSRASG
jgi:hypothetical protein